MKNKSNLVEYIAVSMFLLMCLFGIFVCCYSLYNISNQGMIENQKQTEDCKTLNPKYHNVYAARSGFYRGIPMMAVGVNPYIVRLVPVDGVDIEIRTFLCGDLEALNEEK